MRLKHFLLLSFIFPSFVYAQDFYKEEYFVVKGQVKNFKEEFVEFDLSTYLGSTKGSIRIKPDGSFEQKIPVQNRQSLYLYLNDESFFFTVFEEDTLYFNWDGANFKNSFSVKGKNHLRTNELQVELKLYPKFGDDIQNLKRDLIGNEKYIYPADEEKYKMLNALYMQQVKALFASAGSFSHTTLQHHILGLYFQLSKVLLRERMVPQFKLELAFHSDSIRLDSTWAGLSHFSFSGASPDYTYLCEDWFWNVPEYRDFLYDYVQNVQSYAPFNKFRGCGSSAGAQKPFNPTLDNYYLAQSCFVYTGIKDWYLTKSIMNYFGYYSFTDVENVYQQFMNTSTNPYLKDTLQKYYTAIKRLKPGNPASEFSLKNDKGKMVSLNDFKGKVIYIDFWGVHCAPCIHDIKNYVPALHKKYKDKEVVFINICVDAEEHEWKKALAKYQLDGVNLIAEGWTNNPVCKAYNVSGIPHYILVDENGKIANNNAPRANELLNVESGKNEIDLLLK
jgi:peroxiredoxin